MMEFKKKIDEALDKVSENERLELVYRMMMNKVDALIRHLTFQKHLNVKSAMNTDDKHLKINRRVSAVRRGGTNRHPPKRKSA